MRREGPPLLLVWVWAAGGGRVNPPRLTLFCGDGRCAVAVAQVMLPGPHRGRCSELESHPWVFLRLKEHAFVSSSSESSGLTITGKGGLGVSGVREAALMRDEENAVLVLMGAGFYFMMVERATGHVQGLYHASDSTPFQRLELKPVTQNGGMQFGAVAFA